MAVRTLIFPCHENLPAALAEKLAALGKNDLSSVGVILPTRRLQNYVRLELAVRVKACIPAKIFTLEDVVCRLPVRSARRKISVEEQRLIINALLIEKDYRYLRPGMESDLARFFNELVDENLHEQAFEKMSQLLQRDPYRNEKHIDRLMQQMQEWADLYQNYGHFLDQHQLIDRHRDFAYRVLDAPESLPLGKLWHINKFMIAAFADATAIQVKLFQWMITSDDCEFWFHADPEVIASEGESEEAKSLPFAVLESLLQRLQIREFKTVQETRDPFPHTKILRRAFGFPGEISDFNQPPQLFIHHALTLLDEVKAAAAWVRELIQAKKAEPQEILLAIPDEPAYRSLIWSVFAHAQIPINYALGIPFAQTQVGQWLRIFFELAKNNCRIQDLLSVFSNPIVQDWLRVIEIEQKPSELQGALKRLAQKYDISSDLTQFIEAARAENQADILQFLRTVHLVLQPFLNQDQKQISDWGEMLWNLSEEFQLVNVFETQQDDPYNLAARSINVWYEYVQSLIRSGEHITARIAFIDLYGMMVQNLFARPIHPAGEPFVGVQIMSILETRSLPAKVLILLGNVEGSFPGRVERELFISDPFRSQIGLMTFARREKLQDQQFYRLIAGIPRAHLFWHEHEKETQTVKSRYLQRLELVKRQGIKAFQEAHDDGRVLPGDYLVGEQIAALSPELASAYRLIHDRMKKRKDIRGAFPGDRLQVYSRISATSLEDLIFCPYRFLLSRLDIGEEELPEEESDSRQIGKWAHEVCYYFFRGLDFVSCDKENSDLIKPWQKPVTDANAEAALDRLQKISKILKKKLRRRLDYYYQMIYSTWPKFVQDECKRGNWAYEPKDFELKIEETLEELQKPLGFSVQVSGRIDRIIRTEDQITILDYKLRNRVKNKKAILNGEVPQLPLYFSLLKAQQEFSGVDRWVGEYYSFLGDKGLMIGGDGQYPQLQLGWQNLMLRWRRRVAQGVDENLPLAPVAEDKKCKYCAYEGICRRTEPDYQVQNYKDDWADFEPVEMDT